MDISFKIDIEKDTLQNRAYRKVLYTTKQSQLVLMSIAPNEDIDREIHKKSTQFLRVERGCGVAYVNNVQYRLKENSVLMIPANVEHYIKNTGVDDLKLYLIYSPPEHPKNLVQNKKLI